VDERIEVAVVESPRAAGREVALGSSLNQKQLDIAFSMGGKWGKFSLCPIGVASNALLPEKTVMARICQSGPQTSNESGSLVLDRNGRFLGIVTGVEKAGVGKTLRACRVVSTDILNETLRKLVDTRGNLRAGYLGIYGDTEGKRVLVTGVEPNTPAADAGLLAGDVVVEVDSQPVQDLMELGRILRWKGPGSRPELTVEREGEIMNVQPVLSAHPEKEPVYGWKLELPRVWGDDSKEEQKVKLSPMPLPSNLSFGLVVDTLSPQLASYFKVPNGRGLLVTTVLKESLANRSGFQAGDVLIEINGTELSSPSVMRDVLHAGRDGVIVIRFVRDGILQSRKLVFP
jgi:serine protease Do